MTPEVQPTGSEVCGARMKLALEQQYLSSLIERAVRSRLAKLQERSQERPNRQCPVCQTRLWGRKNRKFCSRRCLCAHMSGVAAERAAQRRKQPVTLYCKTSGKDMGLRMPGRKVTYCSRRCVGRDPDISRSKSEKRFLKWQDPAYRQAMSERARVQVADPNSRFGKPRPSP